MQKFLIAINEISELGNLVTNQSLAEHLKESSYKNPMRFFNYKENMSYWN